MDTGFITFQRTLLVRRLARLREITHPRLLEKWRNSAAGKKAAADPSCGEPSYGELWLAARHEHETDKDVWEIETIRVKLKHIGLTVLEIHHANPERHEMLRSFLNKAPLNKRVRVQMVHELEHLDKARAESHDETWEIFRSPIYEFLLNPPMPPEQPADEEDGAIIAPVAHALHWSLIGHKERITVRPDDPRRVLRSSDDDWAES